MTECNDCGYLLKYPNNEINCLMKQEFCIIGGKTIYPKDCTYFKGDLND